MTDVTIECRTRNPLRAGSRQTLVLGITSTGRRSLTLEVPLGSGAEALMTEEEFGQTQYDLNPYIDADDPVREPGRARLRLKFEDVEFRYTAELTFHDFLVAVDGIVEIRAVDEKKTILAKTTVRKQATAPEIRSFEASPYNLTSGGNAKLSWSIEPAPGDHDDLFLNESKLERSAREITLQVARETDFALALKNPGDTTISQRQLRVHAFRSSSFGSVELPVKTPEGTRPAGILGCFAGNGFLWILLREDDIHATLWKTRNGFDPSVAQWQQERQGNEPATSKPVRVPLQAARRPGVIFQDKLWLLGGDCCHPDKPSAAIGQYHLQGNGEFREGRAPWPARMGHAVVRVDEERIWVAGGWRQGGGPLNDIWQFDGRTWTELPKPGWEPRCLFGATATKTDVWIAGGFESPGGLTYDDIWRYPKSDKTPKWDNIKKTLSPGKGYQYSAGTMFVLDGVLFVMSTHFDPTSSQYDDYLQYIKYANNTWEKHTYLIDKLSKIGVIDGADYFRLDSTPFNGAMFLRELKANLLYVDHKLHYFVKV